MKAIILSKPRKPAYKDVDDLVLDKDDWVKIKIECVGLCGSDMQKLNSDIKPSIYMKTEILGHEFSGDIAEVGSKVKNIRVGDRVTAIPLVPCDSCSQCHEEKYQLCEDMNAIGKTLHGAFAEYVLVPAKNVRKISKRLKYEEAALTDVVATAVHNYHLANSPKNRKVLIYGDGAVGLACLQIYLNQNNNVDVAGKHNLAIVHSLGGNFIFYSDIHKLPSDSYDIIIETVGRKQDETISESIRLIKPQGRIVVCGIFESGYIGKFPYRDLFRKEAILSGSNAYGLWNGRNEFDIAFEMMEKKEIDMSKIITHILPLERFSEGIKLMNNKKESQAIRIIYKP